MVSGFPKISSHGAQAFYGHKNPRREHSATDLSSIKAAIGAAVGAAIRAVRLVRFRVQQTSVDQHRYPSPTIKVSISPRLTSDSVLGRGLSRMLQVRPERRAPACADGEANHGMDAGQFSAALAAPRDKSRIARAPAKGSC